MNKRIYRRGDWESRLADFLSSRENLEFKYGVNDCCLFVADAVKVMTGIDPAGDFRGKYKNLLGSKRILKGLGVRGLVELITRDYGFEEIDNPAFAHRGDVVLVESAPGDTMGLIDLSRTRVAIPGDEGLVRYELDTIKTAWRIG